jgi:RNA polymerase sigma-70 factor (ECF subfamily)
MEDYDVIRQVKEGNAEAFSILVEKYHRQLLNFVFRLVKDREIIEDIGQEVFLNVYKSLSDFDESRGTPFSAWLFITAKNRCISELRGRRGKEEVSLEDIDLRSRERTAEEILIAHQERLALQASLDQLPEPYKGTILKNLLGNSLDEIAGRDGISLGTVKSRLFRARKKIKLLLSNYYGDRGYERI